MCYIALQVTSPQQHFLLFHCPAPTPACAANPGASRVIYVLNGQVVAASQALMGQINCLGPTCSFQSTWHTIFSNCKSGWVQFSLKNVYRTGCKGVWQWGVVQRETWWLLCKNLKSFHSGFHKLSIPHALFSSNSEQSLMCCMTPPTLHITPC